MHAPSLVTTKMNTISSNNSSSNSNSNNNNNNSSNMASTTSIKINFLGVSRGVDIPLPATLAALQQAVGSSFGAELPARSGVPGADGDLCFTYKDPDGDDIVFDKDSELNLALRLCPRTLEILAAVKEKKEPEKPADVDKIYKVAARTMREYHGVPSMTPPKLIDTLALLKLGPNRLIAQGLAPQKLLMRTAKKSPVPLGSSIGGEKNEDLEETVTADMELMTVEDDKKEWNDGFEAVGDAQNPADSDHDCEKPAESDASAAVPSSSEDESEEKDDGAGKPKRVIHDAFLAAGIKIRPRETKPLLLALGVHPHRLVKLGLVDAGDVPTKRGHAQHRHRALGPHMGGPHMGGPHMGGPHMGGPHMGGPHMGGPHMGGPHMGGHGPGMGHGGKPCCPMRRHRAPPPPVGVWFVASKAPSPSAFGSFGPKGKGKGCRGPHAHGGRGPMHMNGPPAMEGCPGGGHMCGMAAQVHGPPPGHHGSVRGGGCRRGGGGQQQFRYHCG